MTNEEKAKEILDIRYNTRCHHQYLIDDLIKMAEWKDKAFLSIIEAKLNYARDMIKENQGKSVRLKYEGMRKVLIEIKNELNVK